MISQNIMHVQRILFLKIVFPFYPNWIGAYEYFMAKQVIRFILLCL